MKVILVLQWLTLEALALWVILVVPVMTDLPALDTLLESLSKDNNVTQRAASIILNYESFKSQISDILLEKVSSLIKKRRCLRKSA